MRLAESITQIILVVILLQASIAFADTPLRIVTDPWPPYAYHKNNAHLGTDVEVTKAVFHKLGIPIEIEFLPWKRCLELVKNKEADAILAASVTPERRQFLDFPSEPVSEGVTVFFTTKERPISMEKLDDLNQYKAGAIAGYKYCEVLDNSPFVENAERVKSLEQNFNKLLSGRLDFVIGVDIVGFFKAKEMGILDQISVVPNARYCHGGNHLAFAKKPGSAGLAEAFSQELIKFKQTKQYSDIMARYGVSTQ